MFSLNPTFVISEVSETGTLLEQARAGDTEAFGDICRAYETRLLRQALTLCGNEALAEELAQDTLVEAWKHLSRYNGKCQLFTWLCAILLNRYRNTLRRKRPLAFSSLRGQDQDRLEQRFTGLTDGQAPPDEAAQLEEEARAVLSCIQTLPEKYQRVIFLRFYVDHSLEGIAEALGCSLGTVKSQLFRALDRLRGMKDLKAQFANLDAKGRTP